MKESVRPAAVAGSWYPASAAAIVREVDRYLDGARPEPLPGRLVALVSPHAGLRYSGPVAAWGYRLLRERRPACVVIVGPSHRAAFRGVALHGSGAWETPLGRMAIDDALAAAILAAGPSTVFDDPAVHRAEHSLEMQLPFVQRLLPQAKLVPLMMGSQSPEEIDGLAGALGTAMRGRDALLVASSDLSHYLPAVQANRLDALVTGAIARFDAAALQDRLETHENVACGGGPVVAVMKAAAALGADAATVLKYGDSGDVEAHDKSQVVGYVSAALRASES